MSRLLHVCSFQNRFDNLPRQCAEVAWEELVRRLTRHREWKDRDGELWSPVLYMPGTTRSIENTRLLDCFVLDMDRGDAWEPYLDRWADLEFVIHTSYRHTAAAPRWRAVFPLTEPQPGGEAWKPIWTRLAWGLARHTSDASCIDPCRMYYLPSHPPGSEDHFALHHEGRWLDPTLYTDHPPPPPAPPKPTGEIPRERAGRVDGMHLVDRAIQIARFDGWHAGCKWLMIQAKDNGFAQTEAQSLGEVYVHQAPRDKTADKPPPYHQKEMERTLAWAFAKPVRDRWAPKTWEEPVPPPDPPPPAREQAEEDYFAPPVDPPAAGGPPSVPPVAAGGEEPVEPERTWRTFTFAQLAEMGLEEPQFPVDGLLREGINLFMGKTGDGKTWFSTDVAMAIAAGGKALGHRDVLQGDVLYLAFEESRGEMFQRLLQIREEEHEFPCLEIAASSDEDWPMTSTGATLRALEEWLTLHPKARLVVFDPLLGYLAQAAPNSAIVQADYNMIRSLRLIARRHPGVAFLVHDHRSKAAVGNGREPQDTGVHSTGLIAAADNRLTLVREEGNVFKLHVRGRMVPNAELRLHFDPGTGAWEVREDRRGLRQSEVGVAIIRELSLAYPDTMHYSALAERLSSTIGTVKGRLFRLVKTGHVVSAGGGYYRAPED